MYVRIYMYMNTANIRDTYVFYPPSLTHILENKICSARSQYTHFLREHLYTYIVYVSICTQQRPYHLAGLNPHQSLEEEGMILKEREINTHTLQLTQTETTAGWLLNRGWKISAVLFKNLFL